MTHRARAIAPTHILLALAIAAAALPRPLAAQDAFRWSGRLDPGRTIEVKGVRGDVRAVLAEGDVVEVIATKSARRSDPDEVTFDVFEHDDGITICAVYPNRRGRPNECAPGSRGRMSTRDNDVTVDFVVRVPAGVHFAGRTVNGKVQASGLASDVVARTVNGSIEVSTSGFARASTVNGAIRAALGRTDWAREVDFETVNGSITVELPADANAEISARTVNGSISTDFPLTVQGRFNRRRVEGTIGSGGRRLELSTVNGSITLRRGS